VSDVVRINWISRTLSTRNLKLLVAVRYSRSLRASDPKTRMQAVTTALRVDIFVCVSYSTAAAMSLIARGMTLNRLRARGISCYVAATNETAPPCHCGSCESRSNEKRPHFVLYEHNLNVMQNVSWIFFLNVPMLWAMTPCCLVDMLRHVEGTWYPIDRRTGITRIRVLIAAILTISQLVPLGVELIIASNKQTNKLHGLSPRANYTGRATAACRRSDCQLLRIKGATWSA
jgi:hypothetical protein